MMNKRYSILSIAAVVAVAGILLGSKYSNTQVVAGSALSVTPERIDKVTPQTIDSATAEDVASGGGLVFNMVGADAIPLNQVAAEKAAGRTVHEITLTPQSVDLPIQVERCIMQ